MCPSWESTTCPLSKKKRAVCTLVVHCYRLWDSNPHSFELDFESSASTNSAKPATSGGIKQGMEGIVKRDF